MLSLNSIKQRLPVIANIRLTLCRFDYVLIFLSTLSIMLIVVLSFYYRLNEYIWQFVRANVFSLVFIILANCVLFYWSYQNFVRKRPSIVGLLFYAFIVSVFVYGLLGVVFILDGVLSKAHFTNGINIFIFTHLLFFVTMLSKYDFPKTVSFIEFYKAFSNYLLTYFGVFLVVCLVVSVIGYINMTFVYVIATMFSIWLLFISKALLANIRI